MSKKTTPKTLLEAIRYFSDEDVCIEFVAKLRWPDGEPVCPKCGSKGAYYLSTQRRWKCKTCRKQFSVKVGTIFEDSPIPLTDWLPAVWMVSNDKNGISSYEIARALNVTQKSAWFMGHRIRKVMEIGSIEKFSGEVEADETLIGGSLRFMHKDKKLMAKGRTNEGKAIVMGVLERHGKVRAKVVGDTKKKTLQAKVRENVKPGAQLFTDALASYEGLDPEYVHQVINHAECYVKGNVHTNCMENFWSLLKRGIKGTYVSVEPFHLDRYLAEETFRYNEREGDDSERFVKLLGNVSGKRLTYRKLIGETTATA